MAPGADARLAGAHRREDARIVEQGSGSDARPGREGPGGPAVDDALVRLALAGDLEAFNELVRRYQDFLFGLVARMLDDREAAADVVQEAFLSAYRNLAAFRGGAFRGWLARIALNAATDVLRGRKRRPSEPYPEWQDDDWQPPAGVEADPEHEATRRARGRALVGALAAIGADQRRAIVLYDVEGFDYGEIADLTGVSLGTVKSRIHRGRLALRELLTDQLELFRD
ncbi:MAG: RNA polymerase sigma factor [Candidatus Limnocylindrales bacterium]